MAINVVVNTDEITVLGPPTIIDVAVDVGEKGQRGSRIYTGIGDPADLSLTDIQPYDIYINTSTGNQFSWIYQYVAGISSYSWQPILKMQPYLYSTQVSATFTSGNASIVIPISSITSVSGISDVSKYVVQVTPVYSKPIALTISSKSINVGITELTINLSAVEFTSTTPALSSGTIPLEITISMV